MKRSGHKGKVDANQAAIVKELRSLGFSVGSLASMGAGWPDIAVGMLCIRRGLMNFFFEIKVPGAKLTVAEKEFHTKWRGQVDVIETTEDALRIMKGGLTRTGERTGRLSE